jgi:membrane-associated phospholipid phosphatase
MTEDKQTKMANGKICYIEIPASDVNASAGFYQAVFGWQTRQRSDGQLAFDDGVGEVSGTWALGRKPATDPGLLIYIMVDSVAAAAVARFYGVTDVVPLYNPAARQVSKAQGKNLSENARIFALLNIAMFDAAVSVFETKYFYNLWRPVTAIRAGDRDGNRRTDPDPNWLSLVVTPPFPSYPSGHASVGGLSVAFSNLFTAQTDTPSFSPTRCCRT